MRRVIKRLVIPFAVWGAAAVVVYILPSPAGINPVVALLIFASFSAVVLYRLNMIGTREVLAHLVILLLAALVYLYIGGI